MKKQRIFIVLFGVLVGGNALLAEESQGNATRTIRLLQDDAQLEIASKVYALKYVKATDIRPYIQAAIKRYHSTSQIERVNYSAAGKNYIIVSTGEKFMPYVDELIAKIDRPGKADELGSIIEGTGVTRIAYTPNYRGSEDIVRILNAIFRSGEGIAFFNRATNTIYWKDDKQAAQASLAWVKSLDRPVPQVNLRVNYYEIRESKLRDIGVDYLAWKNGPGLNLFEAAYNGGKVYSSEAILALVNGASKFVDIAKSFSTSWGYGGFFTAPQFDMSFIRLLQQSGNAKLAASTNLTFINTAIYEDVTLNQHRTYRATLVPDYQNLDKDDDDRTNVVTGGSAAFDLQIVDPVICFAPEDSDVDHLGNIPSSEEFYARNNGNVMFSYQLLSRNIVERNNRGDELGNSSYSSGSLTLGFKNEKLLSSYIKENDVEQTIGIPFLVKIPILKYLFGTTTSIKEKTYIIVTAEANLVHPELMPPEPVSHDVIRAELN